MKPTAPKPPPAEGHGLSYDRTRGTIELFYSVAFPNQTLAPVSSELWRYSVTTLPSGSACAPMLSARCRSGVCLGGFCCASACQAPMVCDSAGLCVAETTDAGTPIDGHIDIVADADASPDNSDWVDMGSNTASDAARDPGGSPAGVDGGVDRGPNIADGRLSDAKVNGNTAVLEHLDARGEGESSPQDGSAGADGAMALDSRRKDGGDRAALYSGLSCGIGIGSRRAENELWSGLVAILVVCLLVVHQRSKGRSPDHHGGKVA